MCAHILKHTHTHSSIEIKRLDVPHACLLDTVLNSPFCEHACVCVCVFVCVCMCMFVSVCVCVCGGVPAGPCAV